MGTCRFQSFDDASARGLVAGRIALIRAELRRQNLDGFVIPRADQHQGEYVPDCDARLAWAEMQRRQPLPGRRVIFGHSMGGAVAVTLASNLLHGSASRRMWAW